jgi:hypothetical protein
MGQGYLFCNKVALEVFFVQLNQYKTAPNFIQLNQIFALDCLFI